MLLSAYLMVLVQWAVEAFDVGFNRSPISLRSSILLIFRFSTAIVASGLLTFLIGVAGQAVAVDDESIRNRLESMQYAPPLHQLPPALRALFVLRLLLLADAADVHFVSM